MGILVIGALGMLWYTDANRHPCDLREDNFFTAECKIFRANTEVLSKEGYSPFENPSEGEYVQPTLGITIRFESLLQSEANDNGDPEDTAVYFEFDERVAFEHNISRLDHREVTRSLFIDLSPLDDSPLEMEVINGNCKNDTFPNRSAFHQVDADANEGSGSITETSFEGEIEWSRTCVAHKDTGKYAASNDFVAYVRSIQIGPKSN